MPESSSHVTSVHPKNSAASFSLAVREDQRLMNAHGSCSLPDKLSQDFWVYPSTRAASRSLSQADGGKRKSECLYDVGKTF